MKLLKIVVHRRQQQQVLWSFRMENQLLQRFWQHPYPQLRIRRRNACHRATTYRQCIGRLSSKWMNFRRFFEWMNVSYCSLNIYSVHKTLNKRKKKHPNKKHHLLYSTVQKTTYYTITYTAIRSCWVRHWPWTKFRLRRAWGWNSHRRTWFHKSTFRRFRCDWWNHLLGT